MPTRSQKRRGTLHGEQDLIFVTTSADSAGARWTQREAEFISAAAEEQEIPMTALEAAAGMAAELFF
jgi:hypothetical protein